MRLEPLTRLRLAFAALGVVLLTPLGFLLHSVNERIEAERRLRHQVVAERIFDELERELTTFLETEAERAAFKYARAKPSDPWASSVVGYFTIENGRRRVSAQRDEARLTRVLDAWTAPGGVLGAAGEPEESATRYGKPVSGQSFAPKSAPDVMQKLNRSQELRSKKASSAPSKSGP